MNQYEKLITHTKQVKLLDSISQLLDWDLETYIPAGSVHARAEQLELLASLQHSEKTSPHYASTLEALIDLQTGQPCIDNLSLHQLKNLQLLRKDYLKQAALPNQFVKEFAKLTSQAHTIWVKARKENNYSLFLPHLQQIIEMNRKKADYIGYQKHPYDALLDEYEPEMTTSLLDPLFDQLSHQLSLLIKKIMQAPAVDTSCIQGEFAQETQWSLSELILEKIGFNRDFGRLDTSTHPFCIALHPTDIRITTRFHTSYLLECLSSVLHEAGHALYEMGLPQDHFGTPIGEAISLGIHESQSRFWETFIGQSKQFWMVMFPKLSHFFPTAFKRVKFEDFYRAINIVRPSLIRVEADEATYCLHVIIRYRIEKQLMSGDLAAEDIPAAWQMLTQSLLNISVPNDKEGCLQDVHWSKGSFGYFPTYALGNLYAAEFFDVFEDVHPNWGERALKEDNFHFIAQWLREQIHQQGHLYSSDQLLKKVCDKTLNATTYLNYLEKKYQALYS